jgi:uncharacterized membrane protein
MLEFFALFIGLIHICTQLCILLAMLMLELTVIHSTVVLFQRFTTAAAELNGVLYVVGGYDFHNDSYLQL